MVNFDKLKQGATKAGKQIGKVATEVGSDLAHKATDTATAAASVAASTIHDGIKTVQDNSFAARLRKARINGFRDGIKQGAYLTAEKRYKFYYAYVATLCYFLRCDGPLSGEEEQWLRDSLNFLKLDGGLPDEPRKEILTIASNDSLDFEDVKERLDEVSIASLESIAEQIQIAIEADGEISPEEETAEQLFSNYISARTTCLAIDEGWASEVIERSVREYGENLERIDQEFKEKTRLQGTDDAFLIGATMLQVARVLVINTLTAIESAGKNNAKEEFLHDTQSKILEKFKSSESSQSSRLYASIDHIISSRGVPYDATRYEEKGLKIFRGANHRFSTLGHDPLLGLIFGTANIMTNSITCVENFYVFGIGGRIPVSYAVDYDLAGKNPQISAPVSTIELLTRSGKRVVQEPNAAASALIKQLMHIGTDLYTPCGIQIPFANLALDKAHAEKLTKYVDTGEILKVGVQAGMAALINWLIAALHGCPLVFKDSDEVFDLEAHQIRTKKILIMSDTIATSSSVIQAAITGNPKALDLGGAAVLAYRLFTDIRFISRVKEEYVKSELDKIYDERAKGLL